MGAIVILFMAGLEMTPKEFLKGGKASFTVGTLGVVVPFFAGLVVFLLGLLPGFLEEDPEFSSEDLNLAPSAKLSASSRDVLPPSFSSSLAPSSLESKVYNTM